LKAIREQTLSTQQIKTILYNSKLDYETIINKALNAYLPQIFLTCPFTNQLCLTKKQCLGCEQAYQAKEE